jgi:segregation and condensation protein B
MDLIMDVSAAIEALLYVIDEPLSRERLYELFSDVDGEKIEDAINLLRDRYNRDGGGLSLRDIAGGIQLSTRPEFDDWIREYLKVKKRSQLSRQALETLAIIAYEQPITTPEIKEIRGADPSGVIRTLLQRKLIRISGRKEVIGRPFMYRTTQEFLVHFGLPELGDLPKPDEFISLLDDLEEEFESQVATKTENQENDIPEEDSDFQRFEE